MTNLSSCSKPRETAGCHPAAAGTNTGVRSFAASAVTAMTAMTENRVGDRDHCRELGAAQKRAESCKTHKGAMSRKQQLLSLAPRPAAGLVGYHAQ
jgi:hypothetical protein